MFWSQETVKRLNKTYVSCQLAIYYKNEIQVSGLGMWETLREAMRVIVEAQETLLQDHNRLRAYDLAIRAAVNPGALVMDLGSGSGILGLLALRAGARHVYAVDSTSAIALAREAARVNGVSDRITFLNQRSASVQLPQAVDLIVGDQSGPMGWEGDLIAAFSDAAARLLRPGGLLIPGSVSTWVAPVDRPDLEARAGMWRTPVAGLDYSFLARRWASSLPTVEPGGADSQLGPGIRLGSWDLGNHPDAGIPISTACEWELTRGARLSGFEAWFVATLAPGISMTNGPDSATPIQRPRRFFALEAPVDVRAGDRVRVEFLIRPAGPMVAWKGEVSRGGTRVAGFAHSNAEDLITGRPAT